MDNNSNKNLKYIIWHIADIHIRKNVHNDILYAVNQLVENIKTDISVPNENKLVVIAGDVFENKENCSSFDISCFNDMINMILPIKILIIPGNHDFLINRKFNADEYANNQLDLITAVLNKSYNPNNYNNVFMYNKSGIQNIPNFNIDFHILSPIDHKIPEIINPNIFRIAILHDSIKGCSYYGNITNTQGFDPNLLLNYDIVLAGDIHKRQYINNNKNGAYCGSLIQKNKNEDLEHGCIKWYIDLSNTSEKFTSEFVNFKLNRAFLKIFAEKNIITYPNENLYNKIELIRFYHKKCDSVKVEEFINDIRQKYGRLDDVIDKNKKISGKIYPEIINPENINSENNNPEIIQSENNNSENNNQNNSENNELNLPDRYNLLLNELSDCPCKSGVLELHNKLYKELPQKFSAHKNKWKLDYLYWSNAFCYGEDNYINFNNIQGLNSLIGENGTGKSSIIDILSMALYGSPVRNTNLSNIANIKNGAINIICGISVLIDTEDVNKSDKYIIRTYKDRLTGHFAYKTNIYKLKYGTYIWVDISLSKKTLYKDFNEIITGSKDDLFKINIIEQSNNIGSKKSVKDSLNEIRKYYGLDELLTLETNAKKKYMIIREKFNDISEKIKNFEIDISKNNPDEKINQIDLDIDTKTNLLNKYKLDSNTYNLKIRKNLKLLHQVSITIDEINTELEEIDPDNFDEIKNIEPNQFNNEIKKLYLSLTKLNETENEINNKLTSLTNINPERYNEIIDKIKIKDEQISELNSQLKGINTSKENYEKINETIDKAKNQIELLNKKIINNNLMKSKLGNKLNDIIINNKLLSKIPYDNILMEYKNMFKTEITSQKYEELNTLYMECYIDNDFNPSIVLHNPNLDKNNLMKRKKELLTKTLLSGDVAVYFEFDSDCDCCNKNQSLFGNNIKEYKDEIIQINMQLKQIDDYEKYMKNFESFNKKNDLKHKINLIHDYNYYIAHETNKLDKDNEKSEEKLQTLKQLLDNKMKIINSKENIDALHAYELRRTNMLEYIEKIQLKQKLLEKLEIHKSNETIKLKIRLCELYDAKYKLEYNEFISKKVSLMENNKDKIDDNIDILIKEINLLISHKEKLIDQKQICDEYKKLSSEKIIYEKYLECLNPKTGIPYKILKLVIADLEEKINNMLNDLVDFKISLLSNDSVASEVDDFNINVIFNGGVLDYTSVSGSQKFIIDFCIRLVLSNNHKYLPNFFIIDEGFGSLDSNHLEYAKEFLSKLDIFNRFDWIIVISHINELHNITRNQLKIEIDGSFSKIQIGERPNFSAIFSDIKPEKVSNFNNLSIEANNSNNNSNNNVADNNSDNIVENTQQNAVYTQNNDGTSYCNACKFICKSSKKKERHDESKKHEANVKKFNKNK